MALYSNLPATPTSNNPIYDANQAYGNKYNRPLELDSGMLAAMTGFFETRGFSPASAENIAAIIISQSIRDRVEPMKVLDTIKQLDSVSLSGAIANILNFNRKNTSQLGYSQAAGTHPEIARNIQA